MLITSRSSEVVKRVRLKISWLSAFRGSNPLSCMISFINHNSLTFSSASASDSRSIFFYKQFSNEKQNTNRKAITEEKQSRIS